MPGKVFLKRLVAFSIALFLAVWPYSSVSALTDQMLDKFAANNIMFYDPDERCSNPTRLSGRCGGEVEGNDAMTRMKDAAAKYGEVAINMQLEYGVPWELVFAQMAKESGVGVAGIAKSIYEDLGGYNWLGHMSVYDSSTRSCSSRGKYSIDQSYGPYGDGEGGTRCARVYQSIADMIGGHMFDFMRNGLYDELLTYSSADNWDLDRAGVAFASRYSGYENNTGYWNDLKNFIVKVDEVAAEKGWPTSEDVAKNNNLPVGGRHTTLGNITTEVENHSLHYDCDGNLSTNGTTSASSSWTDGWLSGGLTGYAKEEAPNTSFTSDFSETPSVITISATNSDNASGGSLLDLHSGGNVPHFTVDPSENRISQHGPITKVGSSESSGIEISIVGFTSDSSSSEWNIGSYTADSYATLAKLLLLINSETNITLSSGIQSSDLDSSALALIQKAISTQQNSLNDPCSTLSGATGDVAKFQEWVLKLAIHEYRRSGSSGATELTPDYSQIIRENRYGYNATGGVDCGAFVFNLMHASGWDDNYGYFSNGMKSGQTGHILSWLSDSSNGWTDITSEIHSNDDMEVGDVFVCNTSGCTHTLVFVGHIDGFGTDQTVMASASLGTRGPMPDGSTDVMHYVNIQGYHVFRKTK